MSAQEWTIAWLAQEDCNGEAIVDIMAQDLDLFVFNPSLKDIYQQVLAMREHARMQAQTQPPRPHTGLGGFDVADATAGVV